MSLKWGFFLIPYSVARPFGQDTNPQLATVLPTKQSVKQPELRNLDSGSTSLCLTFCV